MKDKLFKWLFPNKAHKIVELKHELKLSWDDVDALSARVAQLEKQPKPTMADLMRDNLGLPMLDYSNVDALGVPVHYLDRLTREERAMKVASLSNLHQNDTLQELFAHMKNVFGNHSVRNALNDAEKYSGMFSLNGVKMIENELETAHAEFMTNNKANKEYFDDQEIGVHLED